MEKKILPLMIFLLLVLVCLGQVLWHYPRLPAEVACHFNPAGQPDGWCGKGQFLRLQVGTISILAASFLGFGLALTRLPDALINMPNKKYWLAPERRQKTLDHLRNCLLWLGTLTMLYWFDLAGQTFQVHMGQTDRLNHVWLSLGLYLAAAAAWALAMVFKCRKGKNEG